MLKTALMALNLIEIRNNDRQRLLLTVVKFSMLLLCFQRASKHLNFSSSWKDLIILLKCSLGYIILVSILVTLVTLLANASSEWTLRHLERCLQALFVQGNVCLVIFGFELVFFHWKKNAPMTKPKDDVKVNSVVGWLRIYIFISKELNFNLCMLPTNVIKTFYS